MPTRRLIIMRHAKSSWAQDLADHRRPLNERGRRSAPRVAFRLVDIGWQPDVVLSSDSARTTETWQRMQPAFERTSAVHFDSDLYLAGIGAMQRAVSALPENVGTAMLLGHNPGCELMVSWLSGVSTRFTTANAALLEWQGLSWDEALSSPSAANLIDIVRPKEL